MHSLSRRQALGLGAVALTTVAVSPLLGSASADAGTPTARRHGNRERANKRLVLAYYDAVFNRGDVSKLDRQVRADYIQHNPQSVDGIDAIRDGAVLLRQALPDASFRFVRTLAEGDLVAVHTQFTRFAGDVGQATFDLFRVENGLIAEHWDALQDVSAAPLSGNDMFSTLSKPKNLEPDPSAFDAVTRWIGTAFYQQVFPGKDVTGFDRYSRDYRQHNPFVGDGANAAKAALAAFYQQFPDCQFLLKRTIVDGDMILFHSNIVPVPGTLGSAVFDLFRVRRGKIVEHWDVVQQVPQTSANTNTMF